MAKYTFKQFQAEYPDDAACLARIMEIQYGGDTTECQVCQRRTKFHPMSKRRAYACRGVCRVAISNAGMSPASACPMGDHARTGTTPGAVLGRPAAPPQETTGQATPPAR